MGDFTIKAGDTTPAYASTLAGADGTPCDLTGSTVVLRVRSTASPYPVIVEAAATPDPDQAANPGLVSYAWTSGDTDEPGEYVAEWAVSGAVARTFPPGSYERITILPTLAPDLPPSAPLVTVTQVETVLGRSLTGPERRYAALLVEQATGVLELHLNRDLSLRRRVETARVTAGGRLALLHGPVQEVTSVVISGAEYTGASLVDWDLQGRWPPKVEATCTYLSGDPVPFPAACAVVLDAVTAPLIAGVGVASGAISNYSVEGTSITYGSGTSAAGNPNGVGRFPVASIAAVARLRRRVVLW